MEAGSTARLRTNDLNLGVDSCLEFYYHMYGRHMGSLEVALTYANGTDRTAWNMTGNRRGKGAGIRD